MKSAANPLGLVPNPQSTQKQIHEGVSERTGPPTDAGFPKWILKDGFSRGILKGDSQGGFSRMDSQRMDSQLPAADRPASRPAARGPGPQGMRALGQAAGRPASGLPAGGN